MRDDLRASIDGKLARIIDLAAKRAKATKKLSDRIAELEEELVQQRQKLGEKSQPFDSQIAALNVEVENLAWMNQNALTTTEVKTAKFVNGEIRFRTNPPKVEIVDRELALAELERQKLYHLIYSEPDKKKILAEPESVEDLQTISVVQRSRVEIEPLGCAVYTCYPEEMQTKV